jgi:hypothetical protein
MEKGGIRTFQFEAAGSFNNHIAELIIQEIGQLLNFQDQSA